MNTLRGTVIDIQSSQMVSLVRVDVDGDRFTAVILEGEKGPRSYPKGEQVQLVFKETEVGIAKGLTGLISLRNRFPAKIRNIQKGEVLTKIRLDYKGKAVEAIISTPAADEMNLKENDQVEWLVKANEVSLMLIPR